MWKSRIRWGSDGIELMSRWKMIRQGLFCRNSLPHGDLISAVRDAQSRQDFCGMTAILRGRSAPTEQPNFRNDANYER